ncbi:Gfo/Idh/MocA family oxidoreductase [Actinacidiphila glaucinigra]|uniref:Gfo/Idh/MocA family protein n=1 Tax=Actinacidiphila glaucinigra TaxID=235986 RepID=UPI0033CA917D
MSSVTTATPAAKPVGVGIIGLSARGGWASVAHVPALAVLKDKFELRALSTSSADSAQLAGEKYGVPLAFGSPEELVRRDEVDLVVVTVKVPHHRQLVNTALQAGKHVLSEWPLGNGLAEAEEMAALATSTGVRGFVGLQGRSLPTMRYLRDLIADGYVGQVLSTSVVASGVEWGATMSTGAEYLLDRNNGATMLTIPFGHTIDILSMVLGEFTEISATTAVRRPRVTLETGQSATMTAEDQIAVVGRLEGGAVASVHFRGGISPITPFHWEINGTEGDIVVTASSGHLQFSPAVLRGARSTDAQLTELPVPAEYENVTGLSDGPVHSVGHAYATLHKDLTNGTHIAPDFQLALRRHRLLDSIERSAATGQRIHIAE